MTEITLKIKGKNVDVILDLLRNIESTIQSTKWDERFEHSVDIVQSGGESSLLIVHNEEEYHGVKINCCD